MLDGITPKRVMEMSAQEHRWFDNIKKAFCESDRLFQEGRPEDGCLQELCKAIDTAKTLRRSLRGEDTSDRHNKTRFLEFLSLEIPSPKPGETLPETLVSTFELFDARRGTKRSYSLVELIYKIRCMFLHENENLNAAEDGAGYYIMLDWTMRDPLLFGRCEHGRLVCNGYVVWKRLREVLAVFITGLEAMISTAKDGSGYVAIWPPIGSIQPKPRHHRTQ